MTQIDLRLRASALLWVFLDVDGVLTDGGLYYNEHGEAFKRFNALDGQGIKMLQQRGIGVGILSGREHPAVNRRAKELGIDAVIQGASDKLGALEQWRLTRNLDLGQIGHMGDDLPDVPVLQSVGFGASVINGHPCAIAAAQWTSTRRGGDGAVREWCDLILESKS